ncbi:MAG TPA: sigma-70 family RNA polymerase sigma factor [Allosphingosinicella sp.]|jgi:RNA polymerase sigma-70 factor (ECF subfamily)
MHASATSNAGAREERERLAEALGRVSGGSEAALQEVYRRTSAKLFGLILRILDDRGEAEDALQEVYVSVWRRAGSFDPSRASPITWLAALARNRAIDRLRASGRPRPAEPIEAASGISDDGPDALAGLEASEDRARLMGCVDELEDRQSGAIRDAFFGGFSYPELAERGGVPLGTMKSWVRRGLLKLRECLER